MKCKARFCETWGRILDLPVVAHIDQSVSIMIGSDREAKSA